MTTIEITVAPDGGTRIETKGFTGSSCRRASEFIERSLGRQLTERPTREFYEDAGLQNVQERRTTPHADGT